jgi:hypothetical protein
MKKHFFLVIMAIFSFHCRGQVTFQKLLNSNPINWGGYEQYGNSAFQTSDNGYIISGNGIGSGTVLIKLNFAGDTVWTKNYNFWGLAMCLTTDGGFVFTGAGDNYAGSLYISKTDSLGNTQWAKQVTAFAALGYSIKQTNDGGYIVSGMRSDTTASLWDGFVVKFDSAGNMQWNQIIAGPDNDVLSSVEQTSSGGYITAGLTQSYGSGESDILLVTLDSSGNILATKTIGSAGNEAADNISRTSDNGYILAGKSDTATLSFSNQTLLIKLDSALNIQWNKNFSGTSLGKISVSPTLDGGYITTCGGSGSQICLVKTNSIGDTIWTRGFSDSISSSYAATICQTSDQGYLLSGYRGSFSAYGDVFVIKTDSLGNGLCQEETTSPAVFSSTITSLVPSMLVYSAGACLNVPITVSSGVKDSTICSSSSSLSVKETLADPLSIYPNPASDLLTISVDGNYQFNTMSLYLFETSGKQVANYFGIKEHNFELKRNKLNSGIYFLRISLDNKEVFYWKIIFE